MPIEGVDYFPKDAQKTFKEIREEKEAKLAREKASKKVKIAIEAESTEGIQFSFTSVLKPKFKHAQHQNKNF